ncbi:PEGA domain-containing protein [Sorangium sp. So ce1151]|uniref:PEGA domain-containing protein n=1 Tax=Sorangium sp. So ce1151 TaxID=3133332 RepID=UPI003F640B2E
MKDLVRRARKARDRGSWTEAYEAYKAALDAANVPPGMKLDRAEVDRGAFDPAEIAGELGLCELELRKYRDAAEHLTWSLERDWALPSQLQERFLNGQRKAAFYVVELVLSVDPPDAEILIDGQKIDRTARTYKLFLEPGRHMVRARAPGREDGFHAFNGKPGDKQEISMKLPGPPVSSATEAPAVPKTARAVPTAPAKEPDPWASWPGMLRVTGIAAATAGVSIGTILMIRADKLDDDLTARRNRLLGEPSSSSSTCWKAPLNSPCAELARLQDARNLSGRAGVATVIAGGVVGAVTAASLFTDFSFPGFSPARDRIHVSPVATGKEIGARIEGLW